MDRRNIDNLVNIIYELAEKEDRQSISNLQNKFSIRSYLRMVEEIANYLSENARVLDWGCGYGQMSYFLNNINFKTIAYDVPSVSKDRFQFLRKLGITPVVDNDPVFLPFLDGSFDAVLSCGVLEHVLDKEKSLVEISRILRERGYLFIYMLPNMYSITEFINTIIGKSDHPDKYTSYSIKNLLDQSGFEILKIRRHNLLPKCFKVLPMCIGKVIERIYNNYGMWTLLENVLLKFPMINLFSGTLEVTARKIN